MERFLSLLILVSVGFIMNRTSELRSKQLEMDKKLDLILSELGTEFTYEKLISEDLSIRIADLAREDRIKAIKELRDETGMDLIAAKEYVDKLN